MPKTRGNTHLEYTVTLAYENDVDFAELIHPIGTNGSWGGDAGDLSSLIVAQALDITLVVHTDAVVEPFNSGHDEVHVRLHNGHYTPVGGAVAFAENRADMA